MQPSNITPQHKAAGGFTLPAILVVVGALLILSVGVLLIVGIERNTSRAFSDRERANLAARAGLEDVKGMLAKEATNDDFMVIQSTLVESLEADTEPAAHLFLARGSASSGPAAAFRYVALFSTVGKPLDSALAAPPIEPLCGTDPKGYSQFTALPYQDKVRASWLPVQDERNRTVGRYAYWVEDLQSRVDAKVAGNQKGEGGSHARAQWPFPAAGLNPEARAEGEPALNQIVLDSFAASSGGGTQPALGKTLIKNRGVMLSPDSVLAAAEITPPLVRLDSSGPPPALAKIRELSDSTARALEKGLSAGHRAYKEQPLVPFSAGVDSSLAGKPKLNLNRLLATGGESAINEMAGFIKQGLPKFEGRKGGLPASEDYLKTLAANAIDYADSEPGSTLGAGYRGLDAYPLVSEFLMRFRWDNVSTQAGRKYVIIKVATYVELWNMSDQPVSGTAEITHDTRYTFTLGANPEVTLADMTEATPTLTNVDGAYWYPAVSVVDLKPNEYRMIKCGDVTYRLNAGPSAVFIPSPLILEGERHGSSGAGYKMKWNRQLVDQSRGGLHRNDSSLRYPSGDRQSVRTTIPGHSYSASSTGGFINNMGDPRMAYYITAAQDANAYPVNFSPNRRNIRYQIYRGDNATKTKVYGRVMPSEWPDGGHNSTCESVTGLTQSNTQQDPDAAPFQLSAGSVLRNPTREEAPLRLSPLGANRFYSATELGRIYDPVMWNLPPPPGPNLPWGDIQTATAGDSRYGGGNTLRIGRPEHPAFDKPADPGMEAYRLLDLFHAGISRSELAADREGPLVEIHGHINLNTASRDALKALAIGQLMMDPKLSRRTSEPHDISGRMAPPADAFQLSNAEIEAEALRIADAIILTRKKTPFASPSEIAEARDSSGALVFGNKNLMTGGATIQRTDSATEEIFARVYEASTVRSRNFRIWVVGQAITPTVSATSATEVLSEVRKVYTVFTDPGERRADGSIDPSKSKLMILHENDF
jgi:type II secretory pathway pseudopilin PulG